MSLTSQARALQPLPPPGNEPASSIYWLRAPLVPNTNRTWSPST